MPNQLQPSTLVWVHTVYNNVFLTQSAAMPGSPSYPSDIFSLQSSVAYSVHWVTALTVAEIGCKISVYSQIKFNVRVIKAKNPALTGTESKLSITLTTRPVKVWSLSRREFATQQRRRDILLSTITKQMVRSALNLSMIVAQVFWPKILFSLLYVFLPITISVRKQQK